MAGKIGNYVGGPIFIPLGTDGTDVYGITVDSSGHLQVDVLSLEGLDDLATQTTLAAIETRLDAIQIIQGDLVLVVRSGGLSHGAVFSDLVDISGKGVLERVEMSSDVIQAAIRLTIDGQDFRIPIPDGTGVQWVRAQDLNGVGGESAFWKIGVYDAILDHYSLFLKAPIQYNSSLYIGYYQLSGDTANVYVAAYYRPIT